MKRKQPIYKKSIPNPIDRDADSYFLNTTTKKFVPVKINKGKKSDILRIKEVDNYMTDDLASKIEEVILLEGPFARYKTLAKAIESYVPSFNKDKIIKEWRDYLILSK